MAQTAAMVAAAMVAQGLRRPVPSGTEEATVKFLCLNRQDEMVVFTLEAPVTTRFARSVQRLVRATR